MTNVGVCMCAKYQVGGQFPQSRAESWAWKAIRTAMPLVHQYCRYQIGNARVRVSGTVHGSWTSPSSCTRPLLYRVGLWYHHWCLSDRNTDRSTLGYLDIIRDTYHSLLSNSSISYHSQGTLHTQIMSFGPPLQAVIIRLLEHTTYYRNQLKLHKHPPEAAWAKT